MDNELDNASEMPADLPWQLLEEITNGFSEEREIGRGGYGVVYKGVHKNGEEIAAKKLYHMPGLDDKQFQNELQSLTRLRHRNIVRLVGKSYEEKERFGEYEGKLVCAKMIDRVICLEYLHNGSLENHLCDESSGLPWHRRYEIIKGICDGLKYLHERGIFHLDLKPANILLDKNMVPKIADFGLSRLFSGTRQSHTTRNNFIGTRRYEPPEYIDKGKISDKFDVFSLGVIIIDIITGPDGYSKQSDMSSQVFIEQVVTNWRIRPHEQWKDKSYLDVLCQQVKICIEIALNCVETERHKRRSIGDIICKLNESETYKPADLPWQLLEEITNGFSEERKIGSGGYGVVYKGVYKNEEIAVKKFYHMPGLDEKQFQNEFQNLAGLRHQNIVRLVGKCYEERERCVKYEGKLVFATMIDRVICLEYLCNGSLEKHLSDESSGLPWHKRYKIIKGICGGLEYLHERGLFHLDLKPANILLDKNMEPKIADFGLSRLFTGTRRSHTTSELIGTLGYIPPEYLEKGKISEKFDVFSLGVIIIGIITGPERYSKQSDISSQKFVELVLENWSYRPPEQWKDESYFDVFCQQVKICIEIALNCVETDRHKRPSIEDIICKLNESETMIVKSDKVLACGFFGTIDVHPTEPWILTNHGNTGIQILNYWTQATVKSFELGDISSGGYVKTAKFIARKQWFVVGGFDGSIHVYCSRAMQEVKGFVAHRSWVTSLAIHPTEPYVLSASHNEIKLWDWEKCWECTRIFETRVFEVHEIAFNPKDTNTFATGYVDGGAEIWNLGSPDSSFTLDEDENKWCMLDYFASGDRQYLITACSDDYTVKIWDLQKKSCIKTLRHENLVSAVCSHPELPILMTASDETVYLWNSTTFRVQSTFHFDLGDVLAFGCIKGSRRVVIGHDEGLAMMAIDHNEEPVARGTANDGN